MLHLNLPSPNDGVVDKSRRKLGWMLLGLLAPELPMLFAFAQRVSAMKSKDGMCKLGHHEWTVTHGFFADSGGFVLAPDGMESFPLTAEQIFYLVKGGYIEMPAITALEIRDKSKADTAAKALAFFQAIRFISILIGRAVAGKQTTPLELYTAAVVFCSIFTLVFWKSKPLDVEVPVVIRSMLRNIDVSAGRESDLTPLDWVEPRIYWSTNWGRTVETFLLKLGLQKRPLTRTYQSLDSGSC
jgi:hypothetical protein